MEKMKPIIISHYFVLLTVAIFRNAEGEEHLEFNHREYQGETFLIQLLYI